MPAAAASSPTTASPLVTFRMVTANVMRHYAAASMRHRLLLAATVAATLSPRRQAFAGDPIMPLAQVHAGMHCTGYSVVRGTTISTFDVDVVDVIDGLPGEDGARIIVTVSGPAVDATGIGPGFSGSPIYCPDASNVQRNIGAISESIGDYGGKTVLATPIELMLSNPVDPPKPTAREVGAREGRARPRIAREGAKPLSTPITISGVSAARSAARSAGRRRGSAGR